MNNKQTLIQIGKEDEQNDVLCCCLEISFESFIIYKLVLKISESTINLDTSCYKTISMCFTLSSQYVLVVIIYSLHSILDDFQMNVLDISN